MVEGTKGRGPSGGNEVDLVVIGAGVVGLAAAHQAAQRGRSVVVLEGARAPGLGISGRNSGVIHAGLHGEPHWRKVLHAVRGNSLLYTWCARRGVPHARTGKLLVARGVQARARLEALAAQGERAGVSGLVWLSAARVAALEPDLPVGEADAVLMSQCTGVVSLASLVDSLRAALLAAGGRLVLSSTVTEIDANPSGVLVRTNSPRPPGFLADTEVWRAQAVVNAAGMDADRIAKACDLDVQHTPCRGDYFRLTSRARIARPIYPVPDPLSGGLGIHLTLGLDGVLRLGPDADWACERNQSAPRPEKAEHFAAIASAWLFPVSAAELSWDGSGTRPKLSAQGEPARDFLLQEQPSRVLHLLGIESPGLTACLSLAEEIADWADLRR